MVIESASSPHNIFQLKITLLGVNPPIWRRVLVPGVLTLAQLHMVLQTAMGRDNCHLHEFQMGGPTIGAPDSDAPGTLINEKKVQLLEVLDKVGAKGAYTYDFGNGWEHTIVVERVFAPEPGVASPVCVGGKRCSPPEDSGGPFGY